MAEPIIAIGGENLIDQVTTNGVSVNHPGGSPFNVAVAAARQGAAVRYVSPISTDPWGAMLATRLTEAGVVLTGGRNDRPTTMARVTIANGLPTYHFERNGTAERAVTEASLAQGVGNDSAALHTGSLSLIDGPDAEAWEATFTATHACGIVTSLDPNVRLSIITDTETYRARILRLMRKLHLLKLSDEDLEGLFPNLCQDAAMARVLDTTDARLVVLTRGGDGASAWLGGSAFNVSAATAAPLVDTVGAGDTFMATLLVSLATLGYLSPDGLARLTVPAAMGILQRAALAAALNCEREGCNPPLKAELDAALPRLA